MVPPMSDEDTFGLAPETVLSVNLRARVRRSADGLWVGLGESFFVLTGPAVQLWELIDGRADLGGIAKAVAGQYGVADEVVLADAVETFTPLLAGGLLCVQP